LISETAFRSATALAGAIRMREIGARELLEHYINRIERHSLTWPIGSGTPEFSRHK
jgi:Asp-tRNA(Asn)/Glu-tRNA(Gln) amidotransferase A subunit family amidase